LDSSATSKVTQRIRLGFIEVSISSLLSLGLLLGGLGWGFDLGLGWSWSGSFGWGGGLGWGGSFSWGGSLGWGGLLGWGSWGGNNLWLNSWVSFLGSSLLLLQVLGEEFLISDMNFLGLNPLLLLVSL
jgi:hypothetical protein